MIPQFMHDSLYNKTDPTHAPVLLLTIGTAHLPLFIVVTPFSAMPTELQITTTGALGTRKATAL